MTIKKSKGRAGLIEGLLTTQTALYQAVSGHHSTLSAGLNLHPTDLACIDHLLDKGPSPAGELAKVTGLTTGAFTSVIDRLELGGYVRREVDKNDRRRVMVKAETRKLRRLLTAKEDLGARQEKLLGNYTIEELAIITDFLTRSTELYTG